MLATQAFLLRYHPLHEELIPELVRPLSDEQLRQRPHPHATPIAWHLWHMARAEDVGVNRLVTDATQVLSDGNWDERMNLTLREWGTGQTADQVTELVERLDIRALHGYRSAVVQRTLHVVEQLPPGYLEEVPADEHVLHVMLEEGVAGPAAGWLEHHYVGQRHGWYLFHCCLTHSFYHLGQALLVRKLLGIEPPY